MTPIDGLISGSGALPRGYNKQGDLYGYLMHGSQVVYEPFPRFLAGTNNAVAASGVMNGVAVYIPAGITLTKLTGMSATTAAVTPTNHWFALYDPSGNLCCSTADQGAAAWASNIPRDLAIARDSAGGAIASFTTTVSGWYTVASMVAAATVPTLRGNNLGNGSVSGGGANGAFIVGDVLLASTSGAGLTATPPATWAAPAAVVNQHYLTAR